MTTLDRKVALVIGVANSHSIATGCAQAFTDAGAEVAMTDLNDKANPTCNRSRTRWVPRC